MQTSVDRILDKTLKEQKLDAKKGEEMGRLDFATVESWGAGRQNELGDLKVVGHTRFVDSDMTLYERLARHLEMLHRKGALSVVSAPGMPSTPHFSHWAFLDVHYYQYLNNLLCVHQALEEALDNGILALHNWIDSHQASTLPAFRDKVLMLIPSAQLSRKPHIEHDLCHLMEGFAFSRGSSDLDASPNAKGYAQFLQTLGNRCHQAESEKEMKSLLIRLVANWYGIWLAHLTSSKQIFQVARSRLNLDQFDAMHTFENYPVEIECPIETFKGQVCGLDEVLEHDDEKELFAEAPSALRRASLLLEALAR